MAAACLARVGVHNVRVVDKRATKVRLFFSTFNRPFRISVRDVEERSLFGLLQIFTGQADGLNSRTLELFHALGIGNQIQSEANAFGECCFWDPIDNGQIGRTAR